MQGPQVVVLVGSCLLLGGVLSARLHVASPLVLLLLGVLAGALLGQLSGSPTVELPPEVVLLLFLPRKGGRPVVTGSMRLPSRAAASCADCATAMTAASSAWPR